MHYIFIIYLSVCGQLGGFHFLTVVNKAAIVMEEQGCRVVEYRILWQDAQEWDSYSIW